MVIKFDANILNVDQRPIRITFGRSAPEASLTSTISQQSSIMAASKTPGPSAIKIKLNVGGAGGPRAASFNLGVAPGRQASPERSGSRSEPNSPERARAHDTQGKRKVSSYEEARRVVTLMTVSRYADHHGIGQGRVLVVFAQEEALVC